MVMIYRGVDNMSKKDRFKENLLSTYQVFVNKYTKKGFNVTYLVVWNLLLIFFIIGVIGVGFAGGAGAGYFASLVKDEPLRPYEDMKRNIYNYEETSEMYFANNIYLGKYRADLDREEVKLDDISPHLINALIATEDEYFYEHEGVVPKAILRAILQEVTNSASQTGGSTLTQQLIKNQILTNEVSFDRKAKEILLALRLENFFTKEEILEAYLNVSPFGRNSSGRNIAGVKTAAKGIFGVEPNELTIPQAAYIAGLPQSPFAYTPYTRAGEVKTAEGLEPGFSRMRYVLQRMYALEYITEKQYQDALAYDLTKDFIESESSAIEEYPYVAFEIEDRAEKIIASILAEEDGYSKEEYEASTELQNQYKELAKINIRQNGYKIHTTIHKEIYDEMERVTSEFEFFGYPIKVVNKETGEEEQSYEQVGASLIDNDTGAIISFVGGRGFDISNNNFATQTNRPNGSTMKPLLLYAPAFESGRLQPGSILADISVPIPAGTTTWTPRNWNYRENGLVTAREAIRASHNIAAAHGYKDLMNNSPNPPMDYLVKQGFKNVYQDRENLSAVLGGLTTGVTVEENTAGYATFANGGNYVEPYLIERIETNNGEVVYEHEVEPVEIYSPQTAYLMLDTLRTVFHQGTGTPAKRFLNFHSDWAVKTGTTNDTTDVWLVGSNPKVTFGIWFGYPHNQTTSLSNNVGGYTATNRMQLLWARLLNAANAVDSEVVSTSESFKMPGGIVRRSYCMLSGLLPSDLCRQAGLVGEDLFNAKFVPSKVDDSLTSGKYVKIGDVAYKPLSSTPSEFVKEGPMLNPDFLKRLQLKSIEDLAKHMDNNKVFENLVILSEDSLPQNNQAPKQVSNVSLSGSTINWNASGEKDVIGYYVYYAPDTTSQSRRIASVVAGDSTSLKLNQNIGVFYVTAINATGKESSPSKEVKLGDVDKIEEEKRKKEEEEKKKKEEEEKKKKEENSGGNRDGDSSTNPPPGNDDED